MNMKRLEISRLMDEYQDNEFFPEEGSSAGTQAVKDRVLAQARPGKKRRIPVKGLLLAAALSAACLLCIAAALPIIAYRQVDGSSVLVQTDGEHYLYIAYDNSEWDEPLVLEDGRLWLVVGGQRTDVTDLIDEETPFIVEEVRAEKLPDRRRHTRGFWLGAMVGDAPGRLYGRRLGLL